MNKQKRCWCDVVFSSSLIIAFLLSVTFSNILTAAGRSSELQDKAIPIQPVPKRPKGLIELGDPFLDTGVLHPGFTLPTGAVWQPRLLTYGTFRTAVQTIDTGTVGRSKTSEWANSLNLFTQLRLTGTERILFGVNPIADRGNFSGVRFEPNSNEVDGSNFRVTTLFFEGDIGELFPVLDPDDSRALDYGFSVGRQPLFFQEGLLMNDSVDSIGIVRNNLIISSSLNTRATFIFGWNDIERNNNREDSTAEIYALVTEHDFRFSTVNIDFIYIDSDRFTDAWFAGISGVQRIGYLNTSFRVVTSQAMQDNTATLNDEAFEASDGTLFFSEISWVPPYTHNNLYWQIFWGIDNFSSAVRAPSAGGPLGRTGILFAAVGLGSFGSALSNRARESIGSALGYQMFFNHNRTQVVVEAGGRIGTDDSARNAAAMGLSFQQAIGQRFILRFDTFGSTQENRDEGWGTRLEFLIKI